MNSPISLFRRCCAEGFGTFWLVFGVRGSAVSAAAFPGFGIGFAGVALAFGLSGSASNGYGAHSPGGYALGACLLAEIVLTFAFLMIVLGTTDRRAPQGFAPIAIGLGLTLVHLIAIPVTNLSVNPARSTGPALFVGGWALQQLWPFWVVPVAGALAAGLTYPALARESGGSGDRATAS